MGGKEPKPKDDKGRKDQVQKLVLKEIRKSRPEFADGEVQVLWAQAGRGDGDWRALVLVEGVQNQIYSVGYNNETDSLYVDVFQAANSS